MHFVHIVLHDVDYVYDNPLQRQSKSKVDGLQLWQESFFVELSLEWSDEIKVLEMYGKQKACALQFYIWHLADAFNLENEKNTSATILPPSGLSTLNKLSASRMQRDVVHMGTQSLFACVRVHMGRYKHSTRAMM
jgi:hypothetical protein